MSTAMTKAAESSIQKYDGFTNEQIALIKQTVAKGATDSELALFLNHAAKAKLDPLAKQIYFQKRINQKTRESTMTIIVSIDGYRLIAERTGAYAGSDEAVFDNEENPSKASVTVYKMVGGQRCAFTASARWSEYCPKPPLDFMWQKMPHTMLAKCAESLALRKAFPADLSGTYTDEEMQQAGEVKPIQIESAKADPKTGEIIDAEIVGAVEEVFGEKKEDLGPVFVDWQINMGKHLGKKVCDVPIDELKDSFAKAQVKLKGSTNPEAKMYLYQVGSYLKTLEDADEANQNSGDEAKK